MGAVGRGEIPRDTTEQQRVGDSVADRVEERAATRRGAGGLGHGPVEQVGHRGEDDEQKPATERAARDRDGGTDGSENAECREVIGCDAGAADVRADGLQATLEAGPPPSVEHARSREGDAIRVPAGPPDRVHMDRHYAALPPARGSPSTCARGGSLKTYPTPKIRNVALVGHSGAGKTTLAEALLLRAGAISRAGRVEDGTTVTDFDPEEQKRNLACRSPWRRSSGMATRSTSSTRRVTPTSSATSLAALAGGRPRGVRRERSRRRRGADRDDLEDRGRPRACRG